MVEPIKPGDDAIKKFSQVTVPLLAERAKNERESRTFAPLRDRLLPKLISGELRVKDGKRVCERVGV
jgi:type I restriction enzyme S subunit